MLAKGVAPFRQPRFVAYEDAGLFDLPFGEIECQQFHARFVAVRGSTNDSDELIQVGQRNQIAFQRFGPFFGLAQLKTGAAKNDFSPVLDIRLVSNFEWQQFWPAVIDRQHVHGEGRFHRGVLVEIVNYDFRISVAL